jgi:hypothetical protein
MNPIMVALGVLLATSVAGNALLFDALGDARDRATRADAGRRTAVGAAQTCSNYVGKLSLDAKKRVEDAKPLIEASAVAAKAANARADGEVMRTPAVPGNACASAEAENREWLQKRMEARHGR